MKYAYEDSLGFYDLAEAWVSEPGTWPFEHILQRLLEAFWLGEFEQLLDPVPDDWPRYMETYQKLEHPHGYPWHADHRNNAGEPNWGDLGRACIKDYPFPGQEVMFAIKLPRDMVRLWCLDQGNELPRFWFTTDTDAKGVGRPSIKSRLIGSVELHLPRLVNILRSCHRTRTPIVGIVVRVALCPVVWNLDDAPGSCIDEVRRIVTH